MQSPDVFALRHSNLNPFLFADIGLEPHGMMLQVVSVFARMGEDPWREAARLAGLTAPAAAASLARQIAAMPGGLWPLPAATLIAARLVTLLPKKVSAAEAGASKQREWRADLACRRTGAERRADPVAVAVLIRQPASPSGLR